jgi:hypothetical protein
MFRYFILGIRWKLWQLISESKRTGRIVLQLAQAGPLVPIIPKAGSAPRVVGVPEVTFPEHQVSAYDGRTIYAVDIAGDLRAAFYLEGETVWSVSK